MKQFIFYIDGKIEPDTVNNEEMSVFMLAVDESYEESCLQILIDSGAQINHQDNDGNTALHYALMGENFELAKFLVGKGADKTIKNNDGETPEDLWEEDED